MVLFVNKAVVVQNKVLYLLNNNKQTSTDQELDICRLYLELLLKPAKMSHSNILAAFSSHKQK
jgi:hypothetical protein